MRQPADQPRPTLTRAPLRVFLSSTSVDLGPFRTRIASLIQRLGQFALSMDTMPLRPELDATSTSLEQVRASDFYVLLLAWRYGTIPEGHDLSVTHAEYREARRLGLPCFVFLADASTEGNLALFPRDQRDSEHATQLTAFRAEAQQQLVGLFTSQDDLVDQVAASLTEYLLRQGLPARISRDLPPAVAGFVGREHELARLLGLLREEQSVQVSALLAGLGGVGKSALASEALHRLARDLTAFPGGLAWVRCHERTGLDGLTWVYDQVLAAWEVRPTAEALRGMPNTSEAQVEAREQALRERLSRLPGPALVLLDNVEVSFPLERAMEHLKPLGIRLLVTARHRPGLPGLQVLPLDVLEPDAAVALFAERARAQGGAWDAARDEADTRTVVEALGRLALAIELAAARAALTGLGAWGLAAEVTRADVLERLRNPLDNEASVRYSLERSLAALTPRQRARFAALGLPAGADWPRPVVEALFAAIRLSPSPLPEAIATLFAAMVPDRTGAVVDLDRLAALSLVTLLATRPADDVATAPAASGTVEANGKDELVIRVRLHPLLRRLAEEAWVCEGAAARAAGVVGLMQGIQAWVEMHRTQDVWTYALLETDEPLLLAALQSALEAGLAANEQAGGTQNWEARRLLDVVIDSAFALSGYLDDGGHWQEGVTIWELALRAAYATGARGTYGAILGNLGLLVGYLGDAVRARHLCEQALAISREVGYRQGESANLTYLGLLAWRAGDYGRARQLYGQSLGIYHQLGDHVGEGNTLNNLAIVAYQQDDYLQARRHYEQALAIAREVGDRAGEAGILGNIAELGLAECDLAQSRTCLDAALPLARASGNRDLLCFILIKHGELARAEQSWADADRWLDEAEALNRQLGSRENEAHALAARARLRRDQGQPEAARHLFARALSIFTSLGEAFETQRVQAELAALDKPAPKRRRRRWPWG